MALLANRFDQFDQANFLRGAASSREEKLRRQQAADEQRAFMSSSSVQRVLPPGIWTRSGDQLAVAFIFAQRSHC